MEWTDNMVLKLLDMYREREALWNCKLESYKNKNLRHNTLLEISESFGTSKEEIEKKIRYLLSHFSRELKKETKKSGSDTDEYYRSKWFAYQSMQFLRDKNKTKNTIETQVSLYLIPYRTSKSYKNKSSIISLALYFL